jgi:hypothetical protein
MTDQPQPQPQPSADRRELAKKMQQLVVRAMKNEAWRQALLSNPNPLIEDVVGIKVPRGVTVVVHEDTATTINVVLPPRQLPAVEVSDDEIREAAQHLQELKGGCIYTNDPPAWSSWPTCYEQLGYC